MPADAKKPASLVEILRDIPEKEFFTKDGKPAYNRIFAAVCFVRLEGKKTIKLLDLDDPRVPNISSVQRAAAKEAVRRRALADAKSKAAKGKKKPVQIKAQKKDDEGGESDGGNSAPPSSSTPPAAPPADDSGKAAADALILETYEIAQDAAKKAYSKYSPLQRTMSEEDVLQGFMADYLERGGHKKFDPEKGVPLQAWVSRCVSNWCIDKLRRKSFQFKPEGSDETVYREISGDQPTGTAGETLIETASGVYEDDPLSKLIVEEILDLLDGGERTETGHSPLLGECFLSPRTVLAHRAEKATLQEIGDIFGVSKSVAGSLLKVAKTELAEIL